MTIWQSLLPRLNEMASRWPSLANEGAFCVMNYARPFKMWTARKWPFFVFLRLFESWLYWHFCFVWFNESLWGMVSGVEAAFFEGSVFTSLGFLVSFEGNDSTCLSCTRGLKRVESPPSFKRNYWSGSLFSLFRYARSRWLFNLRQRLTARVCNSF